jgi:hypothetical protein
MTRGVGTAPPLLLRPRVPSKRQMICSSVKRLFRIVDLLAIDSTITRRDFRGAGHRQELQRQGIYINASRDLSPTKRPSIATRRLFGAQFQGKGNVVGIVEDRCGLRWVLVPKNICPSLLLGEASQKLSDQQRKIEASVAKKADKSHLKKLREELGALRSAKSEAERQVQQRESDLKVATAAAEQKAGGFASLFSNVQRLKTQRHRLEQCGSEIQTRIASVTQKIDELRLRQKAGALRALQSKSGALIDDLGGFARKNASLVPLEVGPLVGELKSAMHGDELEKIKQALALLENRLSDVPGFKEYRASLEAKREQEAKTEVDALTTIARLMIEFAETYIRAHITADIAEPLLKVKGSLAERLISPKADALKEGIGMAQSEFQRLELKPDYEEFIAKHPQPRSQLPTTDKNRYLLEGPLDEFITLVNDTGRAGVVRNLRGDLVFQDGKAAVCFPHENNFDRFTLYQIRLQLREKGAKDVDFSDAPCGHANLERYDAVVIYRDLFIRDKDDTIKAFLTAVDKDELSKISVISDRDLRSKRDAESLRSLQLENDILKALVRGYGMISISNGSSVICQTVEGNAQVHESLATRIFDRLEVEFQAPPRLVTTSVESAFISAKRGQCGAIYASAEDLRKLLQSIQRDKLNYHVLPIWFSQADVDDESKVLAAKEVTQAQRDRTRQQKIADDKKLEELRNKSSEKQRQDRQRDLRQQYGSLARGLEATMFDEIRTFVDAPDKQHLGIQQKWPEFANWYQSRLREQWGLDSINKDLDDYGMVDWKNRVLEASIVAVTFKMKNRELGEYRDSCWLFGYIFDKEFDVARDPIGVRCDNGDAVKRYKLGRHFSSRWIAQ